MPRHVVEARDGREVSAIGGTAFAFAGIRLATRSASDGSLHSGALSLTDLPPGFRRPILATALAALATVRPMLALGQLVYTSRKWPAYSFTRNRTHSLGTPFKEWAPRSSNRMPDPATRSFTVLETRTSLGSAPAATRAAMCTAIPAR
jgi:hypothetical protein